MRLIVFSVSLFLSAFTVLGAQTERFLPIIPEPYSVEFGNGVFIKNFSGQRRVLNCYDESGNADNSIDFLGKYLSDYYDVALEKVDSKRKADIIFILDEALAETAREGSYTLRIGRNGIELAAGDGPGFFYAMQTFIQLLPCKGWTKESDADSFSFDYMTIKDEPRFQYRGMHLDVVRHIFSVDFLKRYIDYLALHKMNFFHIHLTDDQGWRMESRVHPALNEYGSYRDATIIGIFPGTGVDSTRYGGYYTIEQMKDLVDYAAKRYITIVPEIDVPGHSMAILAAYPQFGTEDNKDVKPAVTWGIYNRENNVLAPSEEVFDFLEDVFNELMDVFPGKYIHIGSDECAPRWWRESPATQEFIKQHGLVDEKGLQHYFTQRVSEIVKKRDRVPVGWDEIIDSGVPEGVAVMSWRNARNGYKAAAMGHTTILTPNRYTYMNRIQKPDDDSLGHLNILVPLDSVYKFKMIPDSIPPQVAKNIIGGQGCMWTEYFPYETSVEYAIFPRISALAENYWSAESRKNWPLFLLKLESQFERYNMWGVHNCRYVFEHELIPVGKY